MSNIFGSVPYYTWDLRLKGDPNMLFYSRTGHALHCRKSCVLAWANGWRLRDRFRTITPNVRNQLQVCACAVGFQPNDFRSCRKIRKILRSPASAATFLANLNPRPILQAREPLKTRARPVRRRGSVCRILRI